MTNNDRENIAPGGRAMQIVAVLVVLGGAAWVYVFRERGLGFFGALAIAVGITLLLVGHREGHKRKEPPQKQLRWDALRIVIILGFIGCACISTYGSPLPNTVSEISWGWWAVWGSDAYIVLILLASGLRSEFRGTLNEYEERQKHETYQVKRCVIEGIYEIFPSRAAAAPFVALLFVAIWWGFAGLFLHLPKPIIFDHDGHQLQSVWDAQYYSLVTLTTLSYGNNQYLTEPAQHLVAWELGSGIILIACIFAMLINRVSDW